MLVSLTNISVLKGEPKKGLKAYNYFLLIDRILELNQHFISKYRKFQADSSV